MYSIHQLLKMIKIQSNYTLHVLQPYFQQIFIFYEKRNILQVFFPEAVTQGCSAKKVFLEILQISDRPLYLKKKLWQRYFLVNFVKFLRTPFLRNTCGVCFCLSSSLIHPITSEKYDEQTYCLSARRQVLCF